MLNVKVVWRFPQSISQIFFWNMYGILEFIWYKFMYNDNSRKLLHIFVHIDLMIIQKPDSTFCIKVSI